MGATIHDCAAAQGPVTPESDNAHLEVGAVERPEIADELILEQRADDGKRFATLRAQLALKGHVLNRTHRDDGPVVYWAERWGLVRNLPTIADVQRFLTQIGGQP